jgi:hypothetical protein
MKKIFILLFLVSTMHGQTVPISVINISPENVCIGDSVNACFTIDSPIAPNTPFNVEIFFQDGATFQVFSGMLGDLVETDTLITGEPVYCRKIKIPVNAPIGQFCAWGNPAHTYLFCLWINDCSTGIKEKENEEITPIYTDLSGLGCGHVLLEQRGNVRRKIVIIGN